MANDRTIARRRTISRYPAFVSHVRQTLSHCQKSNSSPRKALFSRNAVPASTAHKAANALASRIATAVFSGGVPSFTETTSVSSDSSPLSSLRPAHISNGPPFPTCVGLHPSPRVSCGTRESGLGLGDTPGIVRPSILIPHSLVQSHIYHSSNGQGRREPGERKNLKSILS